MFTHLDKNGRGQMVDVSQKEISQREAIAKGSIELKNETIEAIKNEKIKRETFLPLLKLQQFRL